MDTFDYDLFVIGGGSGGVRAARIAAGLGARVALAEERYLGGTCVNVGCIPKKLLVYASHFNQDFKDAAGYGWTLGECQFDWRQLIANKDREIARLNRVYQDLLLGAGVTIFHQRAVLADAHTVAVGDLHHSAAHILIATGGWPTLPDLPGVEHSITSNEVFHLPELPRRVLVIGGGYIATEFAGIFNGLGSETTLLYRGPLFLRGFDDDVRGLVAEEMTKAGVKLHFEAEVAALERTAAGVDVQLADGPRFQADQVLYATGRCANTAKLGLDAAGVQLDEDGAVVVDEFSRTSQAHIFAVGDCTERINLTPVAIAEGHAVALTLFGGKPTAPNHDNVPTAVFSQPNIGMVGLTETQARHRYGEIDVYSSNFRPLKHTLTGRDERMLVKLVVERSSDRVVGCHVVGADAGEIVQGFAVAMKCGATKAQLDSTIGIHPTAAEELVTLRQKRA